MEEVKKQTHYFFSLIVLFMGRNAVGDIEDITRPRKDIIYFLVEKYCTVGTNNIEKESHRFLP